ncbi:hypothetical protein BB561_000116 [Smittium simulii]|uniref:Ribosome biogenesis protein NOP53 n=1 Tax=Smittium simulii TaxID=133385 RepID=A0A2T9Z0K8_9FUNG|nr:hypothetical protein BB561_000116 [Smittium simulii]
MSVLANIGSIESKPTKSKASRKGKQAWRKNIDLSTLETGLEERLEEKIKGGVPIVEQTNSDLFQVDTKPDANIIAPPKKKLRIEKILESSSKITVPGKSNKQLEKEVYKDRYDRKLKASLKALVNKPFFKEDPLLNRSNTSVNQRYDVWAGEEDNNAAIEQRNHKKSLSKLSTMELHYKEKKIKKPIVLESALDLKKLIVPAVELPHPGMSYVPDETERLDLVNKVAKNIRKEIAKETKISKFIKNFKGNKNQAIEFEQKLVEKEALIQTKTEIAKVKATIPKTKLGKYSVKQIEIPVKLSGKLTKSLRTLKPESNLLLESFVGLQKRNLIEPRVRVEKKRRYKLKTTEKWSYKDFK